MAGPVGVEPVPGLRAELRGFRVGGIGVLGDLDAVLKSVAVAVEAQAHAEACRNRRERDRQLAAGDGQQAVETERPSAVIGREALRVAVVIPALNAQTIRGVRHEVDAPGRGQAHERV